jgi:DNA modification methylase
MKCPTIEKNSIIEGDSRDLVKCLPDSSVNLIMMSPPYANQRKKHYGGTPADEYVDWFMPLSKELQRVVKDDGSFVLNIKEHIENGERHPYVFKLVTALQESGWKWIDSYIWRKMNPMPVKPSKRLKDAWEHVFHFTKSLDFKFRPDRVKVDSKEDTCRRYERSLKRNDTETRKSGMKIKWQSFKNSGCKKSYPSNVISIGSSRQGTIHPATFPGKLPRFFINLLSDPGDLVLDPFSGSGTTAIEARRVCRDAIGFELKKEYVGESRESLKSTACDMTGNGITTGK